MNNLFNWTVTYRQDSDIVFTYGRVQHLPHRNSPVHFIPAKDTSAYSTLSKQKNKRLVAWFASNCNTASKRESYVKELQKYIPVDIYGKCGNGKFTCPLNSNACDKLLDRSYLFYLAFENSMCKDYVTEKLFRVLDRNIVPVVMGNANYTNIAPPNSYINVADFKSPKQLAEFLLDLSKNRSKYASYLAWKADWEVVKEDKVRAKYQHVFCRMCEKLNNSKEPQKVYADMQQWWLEHAQCNSTQWIHT